MTIYKVTCVLDQFDEEVFYDKLFEIGAISIDISDYRNDSFLDNTNIFLVKFQRSGKTKGLKFYSIVKVKITLS